MLNRKLESIYLSIVPNDISFRNRFLLKTIAMSSIVCLVATIFNLIVSLDFRLTISTAVSTLIFAFQYVLARFQNKYTLVRNTFIIYIILAINVFWIYNGGSNGPTLFVYQAIFALCLFIIPQKNFVIVFVALAINLTGLFLIDYKFPHLIVGYESNTDRLLDLYMITLVFLSTEVPLIYYANKNYRKEQLKAMHSEQIKSAFLANMSHEIRTPMNVLLGFSELLRDNDISSDEKNQYLDIIQQNGNILLKILDNVLDLSKLESNSVQINEHVIDLNHFLGNLKISHLPQAMAKGINLKIEKDFKHPKLFMFTDENLLLQIFNNLISNALKFTHKGTITIGYSIPPNNSTIHFFVKDTGIGIKPTILPFVFERFRQGDERLKRNYTGTGLGLTISKALVKLLNGKIWIRTNINEGTSVFFSHHLKLNQSYAHNFQFVPYTPQRSNNI